MTVALSPPPPSGSQPLDMWLGLLYKALGGPASVSGSQWTVSGANVYRGSGSVGVGTAVPGFPLDVKSAAAVAARFQGGGASTNNVQIRFMGTNAATDQWAVGNAVATGDATRNFDIYDVVAGANRLRISSTGMMGLGPNAVTAPNAYLNISSGNTARALQITQSNTALISGYSVSNLYNEVNVTETDVDASGQLVDALRLNHTVTGTNTKGGRNSLEVLLTHATASNSGNTLRYYCAAAFTSYSLKGDGGTGLGDLRGNYYGINPIVSLGDGGSNNATFVQNATAVEVNTNVQTGSSVWYKSGIQIAGVATDKVRGSGYDAMLSLSGISGAVGWQYGILLSPANGQAPLDSSIGIGIGLLGSDTAYRGIEMASYSFADRVIYVKNQKNDSAARGIYVETSFGGASGRIIEGYVAGNEQFRVDGDSANCVWVRVNSTMRKLEVGAADSGGTNYRMVRVLN